MVKLKKVDQPTLIQEVKEEVKQEVKQEVNADYLHLRQVTPKSFFPVGETLLRLGYRPTKNLVTPLIKGDTEYTLTEVILILARTGDGQDAVPVLESLQVRNTFWVSQAVINAMRLSLIAKGDQNG